MLAVHVRLRLSAQRRGPFGPHQIGHAAVAVPSLVYTQGVGLAVAGHVVGDVFRARGVRGPAGEEVAEGLPEPVVLPGVDQGVHGGVAHRHPEGDLVE